MLHESDDPKKLMDILKDHEDYEEGMNLFFKYWKWLGDQFKNLSQIPQDGAWVTQGADNYDSVYSITWDNFNVFQ